MKITIFEDIIAWQKARILTGKVYKTFVSCKDYSFKDQIQRASLSVMNNVAEGFERKTNKELKNFLFIAKGSCGEVRSMLYIAKERNYISNQEFEEYSKDAVEISKLLSGFIKSIE